MPDTLIAILFILFGSLLILGLVVGLRAIKGFSSQLKVMEKKVQVLEAENRVMRKEIEALKAATAERPSEPFINFADLLKSFKKGWMPALSLIATRIFQAYLKNRQVKKLSLPDSES